MTDKNKNTVIANHAYFSPAELLKEEAAVIQETNEFLESIIHEAPDLISTTRGWFKESLVVYFSTMVSTKQITEIEKKLALSEKEQKNVMLDLPLVKNFSTYGSGEKTINHAIETLAKGSISGIDLDLFYNAISIAKKIREIYGGRLSPNKVDMGSTYDSIRKKAIELSKEMGLSGVFKDKWCPADLFIYNDESSPKNALKATSLNIDENSLNSMFQTDPKDTTKNILAISLKEQIAQAGTATSFRNTLTQAKNYPNISRTRNYAVYTATYYARKFIKSPNDSHTFINLAIAYSRAQLLMARNISGAAEMMKAIDTIFQKTLGSELPPKSSRERYVVDKIRIAYDKVKPKETYVSPLLQKSVDMIYDQTRDDAVREYNRLRKKFIADLQKFGFDAPKTNITDPRNVDMKYLLSKSGCYNAASYLLDGMFTGNLKIPKYFTTLAKQKNPFVAMVAYGIGMGGISPTYLKLTGSSSPDGKAKETMFYGNGFLHLDDDSQVIIDDSPNAAGFYIKFVAKVTLERSSKSKTVSKYSVTVYYQTAGDNILIRIKKLTGIGV